MKNTLLSFIIAFVLAYVNTNANASIIVIDTPDDTLQSSQTKVKSELYKFKSLMYTPLFSSGLDHNNSDAKTYGFQIDFYRARAKKIGFGYSFNTASSIIDMNNIEFNNSTISFSIGPGLFLYTSDRLNLWLGAYIGAAYNAHIYFLNDDNSLPMPYEDMEDTYDLSFFPDISAQASLRLLRRFGVVAKVGWSEVYLVSVGISIGPKRK